jgi:hypothetical protein
MIIILTACVIVGLLCLMALALESNGSEESEPKKGGAMIQLPVAYVVRALKHCMLFSVCLLSFLLGLFALYLGVTGSWDPMTILMGLMGLMGFLALLQYYVMPGCDWLGRWQEKVELEIMQSETEAQMRCRFCDEVMSAEDKRAMTYEPHPCPSFDEEMKYDVLYQPETRVYECCQACANKLGEETENERDARELAARVEN